MNELSAETVVCGLTAGGTAAVLAALERGRSVVAVEEADEPGGQLTSQLVPPDENQDIETRHSTPLYREFRRRVREYYRRDFPLAEKAASDPLLNPGGGSVSALCFEPRVGVEVINSMFKESCKHGGVLKILYRSKLESASVERDRIISVRARSLDDGSETEIGGDFFIDATDTGELIKLSGAEYVSGAESRNATFEPHALEGPAEEDNVQAFTWCLAMGWDRTGADRTIEKPADYDFWRSFTPAMRPAWSGRLLSMTYTRPFDLCSAESFLGVPGREDGNGYDFWRYRRVRCACNMRTPCDEASIMNWPQNDYFNGNIIDKSQAETARHLKNAKQLSLSMLYFLQTELGFRSLYPASDVSGTPDGLAKMPYIRESRRIKAVRTVSELDVGYEALKSRGLESATHFEDSIGTGSYRIDLHPSANGRNYIDIASFPFEIPLRALMPVRIENLLAGAKNIGSTHISNGCFRLHPVEWMIGEGAGAHAAALKSGECVRRAKLR